MSNSVRIILKSAGLTVATLFGGILVGVGLGDLVFKSLPGHSLTDPAPLHMAISGVPLVIGLFAGGAAWGISMGRLAGSDDRARMARAGILGFLPVTTVMAFALLWLESLILDNFGDSLPIHRVFTLLFVPTAFLVASISAWAIGIGLRERHLARLLFWKVGLTSAGAFLAVNLAMEASGWVVGAPGAAERATMVVVAATGSIASALSAGGLLGWMLDKAASAGAAIGTKR